MDNAVIIPEGGSLQAIRLNHIENRLHDNMHRIGESMLDIGRCLNQVKDEKLVHHGQWESWLKMHTGFSPRTAQRYMEVAREVPITSKLAKLEFSKVHALLALPAAERESFAEEVGAKEMSVKELRATIRAKEKAEKEKDAEIKRLEAELEEQNDDLDRLNAEKKSVENQLFALEGQIARGEIAGSKTSELTADEFGDAVRGFIGRLATLPYMGAMFAACDYDGLRSFEISIEMMEDFLARVKRAMHTVTGEIIDGEVI